MGRDVREAVAQVGGKGTTFISQRTLAAEDASQLSQHFARELKLTAATATPADESDFRAAAVAASSEILSRQPDVDPLQLGCSLCLAAEPDATKKVRYAAWSWGIWLAVIFVFFAAAIGLGISSDNFKDAGGRQTTVGRAIEITAITLFLSMAALFLVWTFFQYRIQTFLLRRKLERRPGSLLTGGTNARALLFRVHDAAAYHLSKSKPLDLAVCVLDQAQRRLLLEGIRYRYIVQASDVTRLEALESGETVSLDLAFNIAQQPLHLVLYPPNIKAHIKGHFWWISTKNDAARVVKWLRAALMLDEHAPLQT
jgi:hypothetical protein